MILQDMAAGYRGYGRPRIPLRASLGRGFPRSLSLGDTSSVGMDSGWTRGGAYSAVTDPAALAGGIVSSETSLLGVSIGQAVLTGVLTAITAHVAIKFIDSLVK